MPKARRECLVVVERIDLRKERQAPLLAIILAGSQGRAHEIGPLRPLAHPTVQPGGQAVPHDRSAAPIIQQKEIGGIVGSVSRLQDRQRIVRGVEGDVIVGVAVLEGSERGGAVELLLRFELLQVRPTHNDGELRKHQPRVKPVEHADGDRPWAWRREGGDAGPARGCRRCSIGWGRLGVGPGRCHQVAGCGKYTAKAGSHTSQVYAAARSHHGCQSSRSSLSRFPSDRSNLTYARRSPASRGRLLIVLRTIVTPRCRNTGI